MTSKGIYTSRRTHKKRVRYGKCIIIFIALCLVGYSIFKSVNSIYNLTINHKLTQKNDNDNYLNKISDDTVNSNDPIIQALLEKANNNPKVAMILSNIDLYPKELLELASKKDELIDYVANYPKHDLKSSEPISITNEYIKGEIPHFIQWDDRWGYDKYGSEFMAINGCGPTSLAMVAVGLTGNIQINPKYVADFSERNGYVIKGQGSTWTLMSEGAKNFGLKSKELSLRKSVIINTLKNGQPIIAAMGPGTFTSTGHFLVLSGIDRNNKIIINDPNSKIKSNQTWNIDIFMKETKNLWTFTAK
ncbi:C39 family peptidase [Romboutsia lituseburensis]|uniref:C39 family peptidase n=1 Tax=Romboutsia lituseburensis TaxID=1537 RepID=UPI00215A90C9|nr:C39 family peptidase [Romboutsia lituseburensis]MCR8747128.1 C39 family peptidase [Romboutsia lituseburensis]